MKMTKELIAFATVGIVSMSACDMRGLQVPPVPTQTTVVTSQVQATSPQPNTDEAALREFASRLVGPYLGYYEMGKELLPAPKILLGKIPPQFPSNLPLPEGARVLGGAERVGMGAILIVDAPQAPSVAVKFLRESLEKLGWNSPTLNFQPGGFIESTHNAAVTMCKGKDEPVLTISAQTLKEGRTDVRYTLMQFKTEPYGSYGPCNQPTQPPGLPPQLPRMVAPEGASQYGMGFSSSEGSMTQNVYVETKLSVSDLRAHYDAQLITNNWTLRDKGGDATLAWSRWNLKNDKGDPETGFLFVLDQTEDKADAKPVLYVSLQVSLRHEANAGGAPTVNVLMRQAP